MTVTRRSASPKSSSISATAFAIASSVPFGSLRAPMSFLTPSLETIRPRTAAILEYLPVPMNGVSGTKVGLDLTKGEKELSSVYLSSCDVEPIVITSLLPLHCQLLQLTSALQHHVSSLHSPSAPLLVLMPLGTRGHPGSSSGSLHRCGRCQRNRSSLEILSPSSCSSLLPCSSRAPSSPLTTILRTTLFTVIIGILAVPEP